MTHNARTSWTPVTPDPPVGALSWTREQTARGIGVSVRTLDRLVQAGRIPYCRVGGRVVFRVEALREWLAQEEQARGGGHGDAGEAG